MRHGKKINHLGRTASHRKAMLSNMASSLILNKRISTTVAKAKALRKYVEPLMTKAKDDTTHSRRIVFSYLNNKESVKILFDEVAEKIAARPGGYTRIIKTGTRLGDNAEMCIMELVDYNELLLKEAKPAKSKRRSRRGGKSKKAAAEATTAPAAVETAEDVVEEVAGDQVETAGQEVVDQEPAETKAGAVAEAAEDTTVEEVVEETPEASDNQGSTAAEENVVEAESGEASDTEDTNDTARADAGEAVESPEVAETSREASPEHSPSAESKDEAKDDEGGNEDTTEDDKEK